MLFKRLSFFLFLFWNTILLGQNVFFNEIDHLNPDLCVEIAVAPDTDLTDWFVTTYDELGVPLDSFFLNSIPPSSTTPTGYSIIEVDIVFLSPTNGGLSLADNTSLIQFISYGGTITANGGPAIGQTSEDIGTQTASGNSQQLQGTGSEYTDFNWEVPGDGNCGFENDGQTLLAPEDPLPVELLYFKGYKTDNYVRLLWSTLSERSNEYFVIEKSFDGIIFEEIGRVNGADDSNSETNYSYKDYSLVLGETYYKLGQLDFDGSITYSDIIILEFEIDETSISISPNPVQDKLNIFLPKTSLKTEVIIYNLLGEIVFKKTVSDLSIGNLILEINFLNSGAYLLRIKCDGVYFQQKFIKGF